MELTARTVLIGALGFGLAVDAWRGLSFVGGAVVVLVLVLVYESREVVEERAIDARAIEYLERKTTRALPYLRETDPDVYRALWAMRCARGFGKQEFSNMVEGVESFARIRANVEKGRFDAGAHVGYLELLEEEWTLRLQEMLLRIPSRSRFDRGGVRAGESVHAPLEDGGATVRAWMIDGIKRVRWALSRTRHYAA
jgi:hypothetical protein